MRTIAIIGSGPTAIYTARYLILQEEALSITMFESQAQAGKGTPYHQDWNDKEMLANIASIELPPVTETLTDWLLDRDDEQLAHMGIVREKITNRAFFPRIALGEYFHSQLKKLTQMASDFGSVLTVKTRHKVVDVAVAEKGIDVIVRQAEGAIRNDVFDYVVMATGHAWPKNTEIRPGYFLSPWPASALRTIADCHVGIRGTSLSAIDALVALSVARGIFRRDAQNKLEYVPEPGTEHFHATMMSRKGLLPEADFFHPIPYTPLRICTAQAVDKLIAANTRAHLLDDVYALFKAELMQCDPDYAQRLDLENLTLEAFSECYFHEREQVDPFLWTQSNLAEAKANQAQRYTIPWRYAILRMHEIIGRVVPHLLSEDQKRFNTYFKHIFVDDYATVPHESIERLLALHRAGKLDIMRLGSDYALDTQGPAPGAVLSICDTRIHFPAFIEAMGQRALSVRDFPFPSLWKQGLVHQAAHDASGIALDKAYHPVSDSPYALRLYCLSLPFMLGQFPFAQGITSSHDMGKKVVQDMMRQWHPVKQSERSVA